jgi:hypothetical protein
VGSLPALKEEATAQELNRSWRRRVWDLGIEANDAIEIAEKIEI